MDYTTTEEGNFKLNTPPINKLVASVSEEGNLKLNVSLKELATSVSQQDPEDPLEFLTREEIEYETRSAFDGEREIRNPVFPTRLAGLMFWPFSNEADPYQFPKPTELEARYDWAKKEFEGRRAIPNGDPKILVAEKIIQKRKTTNPSYCFRLPRSKN